MLNPSSHITWQPQLIAKYNLNGPRYTSYPTALAMQTGFAAESAKAALRSSQQHLSLYLHVPFCQRLCYYCGCHKVISRHQHKADPYVDALLAEMRHYQALVADKRIIQVHLGGGTPTFLSEAQLSRLFTGLRQHFHISEDAEISVEIDPRSCTDEKLAHLRELGVNRVSFGVQDLDRRVQIAINRVQETDLIIHQFEQCRSLAFSSINADLIYGLPHQYPQSFAETLAGVIEMAPDRISLFSYAHLPQRFAAQRKIPDASLPSAQTKLQVQQMGIEAFVQAGYQFIGMDHFAKASDSLAQAQQAGRLQRNFQGYTTAGQDAMLGLGASSISQVNGVLWQNHKSLKDYSRAIADQQLPLTKGYVLSEDDRCRAALISQLICHFHLDIASFSHTWGLRGMRGFWQYFADAIARLDPFIDDGLVTASADRIEVTAAGRLWVRSICACFDAYLAEHRQRYSKVV
ncbi:oxygen-independent coproporphyrinogen III oxidase [Idiomarina xiamenensis]|uniref:Coproporphyrinogen-III oxidase n=1 Tax=Idiomarina xiamenensis 10-D-4 TaxID=740709 RepID=K2KPY9_9GAMM|nr:oxygen-independent coproporphyrinogen III oxidase [Idiomarina xiamenensis]EKE84539.1 coproporphyrinogen III oxidase [Idiomarina xiamenensis 10-D-4]